MNKNIDSVLTKPQPMPGAMQNIFIFLRNSFEYQIIYSSNYKTFVHQIWIKNRYDFLSAKDDLISCYK